ncbi:MAG: hypothetical protein HPY76_07160 [Anaerolineae bacterium]|nr:hypothetical protein [Anaerolineae bacterium]
MIKKNWQLFAKALASCILVYFMLRVWQDIQARFQIFLAGSDRIPRSFVVIVAFLVLMLAFAFANIWWMGAVEKLNGIRRKLGLLRWILAMLVALGIGYLFLYSKWSEVISGDWLRASFLLAALVAMTWLLSRSEEHAYTAEAFFTAGILFGSIFIFMDELQTVVAYPFSIGWSEGNRIWDYSVIFGRRLYNYPADQSLPAYIDLGRQTLWGLPFMLPNVDIVMVRLWSALVFTVPYFILGLFVFYKRGQKVGAWLLVALWTFMFLHQGPIYTPLILVAILVAGTRRMPWWLGVVVLSLAGYYAYISRSTWVFTAGMWAALFAFVESTPFQVKTVRGRWLRAIALGGAGIFGGYLVPKLLQVIRAWMSASKPQPGGITVAGVGELVGRQPLLWERLLPNPTNPLGIVFSLLLAVGPLTALILVLAKRSHWRLNIWQQALITLELLAFLVVGIIASVKIGGGNNLHNMDMFLICLVFVAGLLWKAGGDQTIQSIDLQPWFVKLILAAAILYPASQGMLTAQPLEMPSTAVAEGALADINRFVDDSRSGEILFMDQRQLLTFGYVPDVPLVPQYEKKLMMDKALADSAGYFDGLYADLAQHRFTLIVSEPLWTSFQGATYEYGFGDENDAWVKWVSIPVLCFYEPVETNMTVGFQLLQPRQGPPPADLPLPCPVVP